MVQRNLTPGGDKNGADINLALDALEMAFTHDHINAFVIVGGDSDFITLVEKLKQYDKKVFVVGGRQFTSLVMQKNCHEFIAYENLVGATAARRRRADGRRARAGAATGAEPTSPRRSRWSSARSRCWCDREVSPQLGLLKSTLLQLDSTFSERDYGASTFRDFIEKVAQTGIVTLRHSGRSLLVDLAEANGGAATAPRQRRTRQPPNRRRLRPQTPQDVAAEPVEPAEVAAPVEPRDAVSAARPSIGPGGPGHPARAAALPRAGQPPRWPMYVRQVKQFLRTADEGFDERKFGFATIVEFLRACQREGRVPPRARPPGRAARVPWRQPAAANQPDRHRGGVARHQRNASPAAWRSAGWRDRRAGDGRRTHAAGGGVIDHPRGD